VDSPRGTKRAKGKNSPNETLNLNSLKMPALSHRQNQNRGFSRAQIHIISKKERKASRTNERTKRDKSRARRTKKRESLLRQGAALRSSLRRRRRRRGNIKFALFFFIFDLSQFEFLCVCSWRFVCVSLSLFAKRDEGRRGVRVKKKRQIRAGLPPPFVRPGEWSSRRSSRERLS
jgi:hypothetical protein